MEDNELKAAQRIFNEFIFKFPNFRAKLNLGNIYKKQGRPVQLNLQKPLAKDL